MHSFDDIILIKGINEKTNLRTWESILMPEMFSNLTVQDEGGKLKKIERKKIERKKTEQQQPKAATQPPKEEPKKTQKDQLPDFLFEEDFFEVKKGDILIHPKIGKCKVLSVHDETVARIIILESGKLAEINVAKFDLNVEKEVEGIRYISVKPKKRK